MLPLLSAADARRLLLGAQGLLDDPRRRATRPALLAIIMRLGFVQVDTINVVARAHDLTLYSRLHAYKPALLAALLEKDHRLFEHWTHDASIIPTAFYSHWKPRFRRDVERITARKWWQRQLGPNAQDILRHVRERIEKEGPLGSADFEREGPREAWWDWSPAKAALDYLWRTGELAVAGRVHFHKLYDLAERVFPQEHAVAEPDSAAHTEWICQSAAERLCAFTPKELAEFWQAIDIATATAWCGRAAAEGRIVPVDIAAEDGSPPQRAFALADFPALLKKLPPIVERTRLLCPFDPVLRDRARALRRFGFDYRFEGFVPPAKRRYGYYVLPILEGERLVGRLDPKLHRERGLLEVRALYWEPKIKPTLARRRALQDALEEFAKFLGVKNVSLPKAEHKSASSGGLSFESR